MPKFSKILNNFLAGEVSPFRLGRTDVQGLFTNGCLKLENCIPKAGGGVSRRPGSQFLKDITSDISSYDDVKGVPFIFSKEESYGILFGANTTRSSSLLPSITYSMVSLFGTILKASDVSASVTCRAPTYRGGDGTNLTGTYSRSGTTVTVTITNHGLATNDYVYFNATSGAASDGYFQVTVTNANVFTFTHGTSGTTNGNVTIYKGVVGSFVTYRNQVAIQSTYNNELGFAEEYEVADLDELQYVQINDLLIIVHKDHPPVYLVRESENSFVEYSHRDFCSVPDIANFTALATWQAQWCLGVPYRDTVINPTAQPTFTLSGGTYTVGNAVTVAITNADSWGGGFVEGHVGSVFKATTNSVTGVVVITDVASPTSASGYVLKSFDSGISSGTSDWQESAWSDARGWPRSVCYFKGRVFMGGDSNTVWASQLGDVAQFAAVSDFDTGNTAVGTEAFTSVIAGNESSFIQWMDAGTLMTIGTLSREYIADIAIGDSVSSLSVTPQTDHGSAYVQAKHAGNTTLFIDRSRRIVREFVFNFNDDNYRSEELTVLADHLPNYHGWKGGQTFNYPKIKEIAMQTSPSTHLWILNNHGGLFSILRDRPFGIAAWHKHEFAGTDSTVLSVFVLPNPDAGATDDVWCVVERTVDGSTVQYVEKIGKEFLTPFPNDNTDMIFLDSAVVKTSGTPFTTFDGLDHLEGETIRVVADGYDYGDFEVASGQVILPDAAYNAIGGLSYYSTIIPLPIEAGSALGNAQGKFKSYEEIIFKFYQTSAAKLSRVRWVRNTYSGAHYDYSLYELESISSEEIDVNFIPGDLPADQPNPFYTGILDYKMPNGWDREGLFSIRTNSPFPMNIAGIVLEGVTND